jgi:hypothetical protein
MMARVSSPSVLPAGNSSGNASLEVDALARRFALVLKLLGSGLVRSAGPGPGLEVTPALLSNPPNKLKEALFLPVGELLRVLSLLSLLLPILLPTVENENGADC